MSASQSFWGRFVVIVFACLFLNLRPMTAQARQAQQDSKAPQDSKETAPVVLKCANYDGTWVGNCTNSVTGSESPMPVTYIQKTCDSYNDRGLLLVIGGDVTYTQRTDKEYKVLSMFVDWQDSKKTISNFNTTINARVLADNSKFMVTKHGTMEIIKDDLIMNFSQYRVDTDPNGVTKYSNANYSCVLKKTK